MSYGGPAVAPQQVCVKICAENTGRTILFLVFDTQGK